MPLLGIEEAGTCYPLLNDFFSFIFLSVRVCAGHIPLNFLYHLFIFFERDISLFNVEFIR